MDNIKDIILNDSPLAIHIDAQTNNYNKYVVHLILLTHKYKLSFTPIKKARMLVSSIQRNDHILSQYLISLCELPTIIRVCKILDSKRNAKKLTKRMEKTTNPKKKAMYKSILNNLAELHEDLSLSLTKSKIKFLKRNWIDKITEEELNNLLLNNCDDSFKKIIDLFHLKPTDFPIDWFTSYIYTNEYPEGCIIDQCNKINKENILDTINRYKIPSTYILKNHRKLIDDNVKTALCTFDSISTILNQWNDLSLSVHHVNILTERINNDTKELNIPYGELIKKIQTIKVVNDSIFYNMLLNIANTKLLSYSLHMDSPIVVLGDASPSMGVAIKTSNIIASILCSICNAKLHFFRSKDEYIENPPKNVQEVLELSKICKTGGMTAPCASFYPYYKKREIVKTFIIVTDEEENTGYDGKSCRINSDRAFSHIFKKYWKKVYHPKLIFVSFINGNKDGPMVKEIKKVLPEIENSLVQFRLNPKKPDLRKLDLLLSTLSIDSDHYNDEVAVLNKIANKGQNIYDLMNIIDNKYI